MIADVVSKTLLSRPRIAAGFVAIAEWSLRRNFIKKISDRTRHYFPLAYVVVAQKER